MRSRTIAITAGALLGLSLVAIVGFHFFGKFKAKLPTEENFNQLVRTIWERENVLRRVNTFDDPVKRLCISIPSNPRPDARSKAKLPLSWHFDFLLDAKPSESREKQLRKLNAFSQIGLLEKKQEAVSINNEIKEVIRYKLTEKGWGASAYARGLSCFVYGTPHYLGVSRFEPKVINNQPGLEIYEVRAKSGLRSVNDLVPWARDQELQAEFPDISKSLDGQEFVVFLVRDKGEWVQYHRKKDARLQGQLSSKRPRISDEMKRRLGELSALPPPTIDEVKKLLEKSHGVGQKAPWPIPCLYLPGSEKLPVDKLLFSYSPPHYSVAIFPKKDRKTHDRIVNKTIPYLNMLEQFGILSKHTKSSVPGKGKDAQTLFDAYVYELSPSYENKIHSRYPDCFPLGEPTVEFVDVQVAEEDTNGYPNSSFRYKLKVLYKKPPAWMNDAGLTGWWVELRGVLEHGMACTGKFGFDRKTRDKISGSGSCWWAFDSYYENY